MDLPTNDSSQDSEVPFKAKCLGKPRLQPRSRADLEDQAPPSSPSTPVLGIARKLICGSDFRVTQAPLAFLEKMAPQGYVASPGTEGFLVQW